MGDGVPTRASSREAECPRLARNVREAREEFDSFDDAQLRYSFLIELSGYVGRPDLDLISERFAWNACQSPTWVDVEFDDDGMLAMRYWSDTMLVRGVLYVVASLFEGVPAEEAARGEVDLDEVFGVRGFLSERRKQSAMGIVGLIRTRARAWVAAHQA